MCQDRSRIPAAIRAGYPAKVLAILCSLKTRCATHEDSGRLQFAPGEEHLFASSSSDNSLAVWDLRKLEQSGKIKHLASGVHPKTCQSAYFAPDGGSPPTHLHPPPSLMVTEKASLLQDAASDIV